MKDEEDEMELICCVICSMAACYLMTKIQTFRYLKKIEGYTDEVLKETRKFAECIKRYGAKIKNE